MERILKLKPAYLHNTATSKHSKNIILLLHDNPLSHGGHVSPACRIFSGLDFPSLGFLGQPAVTWSSLLQSFLPRKSRQMGAEIVTICDEVLRRTQGPCIPKAPCCKENALRRVQSRRPIRPRSKRSQPFPKMHTDRARPKKVTKKHPGEGAAAISLSGSETQGSSPSFGS